MQTWLKIFQFITFIGKSKKHEIFRARKWRKEYEQILKKPVYNEVYEKIGHVHDIFGPIESPFISIKNTSNQDLNPKVRLYVKLQ